MDDIQRLKELIDRYLADEMPAEEKPDFEQKVREDPNLEKMIEEMRLIKMGIRALERDKVLKKIQTIGKNYQNSEATVREIDEEKELSKSRWMSIAATLLLVATLGITIFYFTGKNNTSELQAYLPFSGYEAISVRGNNEEIDQLDKVWNLYKSGKYEECISEINSIGKLDISLGEPDFLKGLCLLELNQYKKAIVYLTEASTSNFRYQEDAKWYLSLTYLENNQPEKARKELVKIENSTKYPVDKILKGID